MQQRAIEAVCRHEGGKVLAGLARRFGSLQLAEDLLQEAYAKALETWPASGAPANPAAWLTTVARNAGLDLVRREARIDPDSAAILERLEAEPAPDAEGSIEDDRLRLVFTCCHPALNGKAQAMLALRTLCGLSTREIARAYLESEETSAQRMVRAKRKIAEAGIPYEVPGADQLEERMELVLQVVYLVFNEGYGATSGTRLLRIDLGLEAIRLGRILVELLPAHAEARGLLALMILQHARRDARTDAGGKLVTLERQDRSLWRADEIAQGKAMLDAALALRAPGPYQVQAAIAALHAEAADAAHTDWRQISALYQALLRYWPTPVVQLNAAVAVGMSEGFEKSLAMLDELEAQGKLARSHYLFAARADMLRRLGRGELAAAAYDLALGLVVNEVERDYLLQQRAGLGA
jgi:RNA polymerase sigma-70 factor (ECF subfamily)